MSRIFVGATRIETPTTVTYPDNLTIMAWVKQDVTTPDGSFRYIMSHRQPTGSFASLALNDAMDLRFQADYATTDGQWIVPKATIDGIISNRLDWWCIAMTQAASVRGTPVFRIGTESVPFTSVATTVSTAAAGSLVTTARSVAWGNGRGATGTPFKGTIGPVAYHNAILSDAAQNTWRLGYSPLQTSCLLSYIMDNNSPMIDLSSNSYDATVVGTPTFSTDEPDQPGLGGGGGGTSGFFARHFAETRRGRR